ncbi:ElyC/SanA/YdcF family protein [Methylophaga nitratireducenticrescens]|uniref:ElyC/SanA/YdcF family protein n=1 Tax=Methylophaga nitratireducenticrescens TaxID=754476 RepID=UPI00146CF157|nr:ElyC/SanA/YdcF family protein [Methylophaga nitratireducenticrescens]
MAKFVLFQKRHLWFPTIWGTLLILVLLAISCLLILRQLAVILAPTAPVPDRTYLVVEGWQDEDSLLSALAIFNAEGYHYMITAGGPNKRFLSPEHASYAEQAGAFMLEQGLDAEKLIVISAPESAQERTYLSAVMVREWLALNGTDLTQLNVHTSHVHARRTRSLYQKAFPDFKIGIYATVPDSFELHQWWQTSDGAKSVITELIGNVWVACCFHPGEPGSHYEKWAVEKSEQPSDPR